jgi:hypothetical protein
MYQMKGSRLRTALKDLAIMAATGVITLLVFEAVLRFMPVATAPSVEPPSAENPIQRYKANAPYTWSFGWNFYAVVRGRSNAQGYLAAYDYDARATTPLIAVAGDSMMEALHISFSDSLTGRLQAMLGSRGRAYVFAQSGAPLSQYVAYAHHACVTYHPQRLIVSVVGNDFDESVFAHRRRDGLFHLYERPDGTFDYKLTAYNRPGLMEQAFRHSYLALYLARNLSVNQLLNWFRPAIAKADDAMERYVGMTDAAASAQRLDEGYRVIDWFLDALPKESCLPPRDIVLMVDAARPHIYDADALASSRTSYFDRVRRDLIAKAKARGFIVIDLEPVFLAAYAKDGRHFEYPTDAHWDPYGHEVVAGAVRDALSDWRPLIPTPTTH